MTQRYSISSGPQSQAKKTKGTDPLSSDKRQIIIWMLMAAGFVIMATIVVFAYARLSSENTKLKKDNEALKKQLDAKAKSTAQSETKSKLIPSTVTDAQKAKIEPAISGKNYKLLSANFASKVMVVIVGSGIQTGLTPDQAAAILSNYLNNATGNWRETSSADWQNGPYGQYFGPNFVTYISDNGYVISIGYDQNGQITTVLISNNTTDLSSTSSTPAVVPPANNSE